MTYEPHQQRVVDEKKELDEKIFKLQFFIDRSPIFKTLDIAEQARLSRQVMCMGWYSEVLTERIKFFESSKEEEKEL